LFYHHRCSAAEASKGKANRFYLGPTYMDKTGRNGRVGDIELEDFKNVTEL
jgi:hypothetical protein